MDAHAGALWRLAYRVTGNAHDADDVVQETFLRAFRSLGRFDGRSTFRTWITRIALNGALTLLAQRRPVAELGEETDARAVAPSGELASRDDARELEGALDALTPMERTAFLLRHGESMASAEIGAALGVSAEAARQSVVRALRKLRRTLGRNRR